MIVLYDGAFWFVWVVDPKEGKRRLGGAPWREPTRTDIDKSIPLLHWERLEKIVGDLGYKLVVCKVVNTLDPRERFMCEIWEEGKELYVCEVADTRQEAVMRVIIKLGEKIQEITNKGR